MLSNLARCRGMMHLSDVSAEKWKHYYFKSALGPSLFSSASCCCLIELIQTYLISGVSASIYKPADEFETVCLCACPFSEKERVKKTQNRESMDMVPVLNMSVDRRVKQRDNTQTRQCKCVYRKEKHFIRYLQEYLCAWLCVCGRKKNSGEYECK